MLSTLVTIGSFIAAIGLLITVHEFGHYWVARKVGVKVLRFSIGFGKPLYVKTFGKDNTEFVIAAFPLGGYVKMLDESEGEVRANEIDRAFNRKALWKRSAVVAAGPVFNLVFAVFAYWAVFVSGTDGMHAVVGHVANNSLASEAGLKIGDELLAVDNQEIKTWGHRRLYLYDQVLDKESIVFRVRSDNGNIRDIRLDVSRLSVSDIGPNIMEKGLGLFVKQPELKAIIGEIKDGPAKDAGMKINDRIIKINDKTIDAWHDMASLIHKNAGNSLTITFMRGEIQKTVNVIPRATVISGQEIGLISIAPKNPEIPASMIRRLQYGIAEGFFEAAKQTWAMSTMTLQMLYKMLTLEVSTKNISGPITIAQYAGQSASIGMSQFIVFLAVISISLGVLNLLPIPVLDGGHLMYYVIEAVTGSPVSEEVRVWGQQLGVIILFLLMMLAFYNDIIKLISN